ncbi:MAG: hypothetical protein EOP53_01695 [Sphingobacteriales bacterium]|nr:MAG: hypothetical protein EOP53_01695 [Sphingobacteriales bacterium]
MSETLTFKILRVKDTAFSVNENLHAATLSREKNQVRIDCDLKYNTDANLVMLELNAKYFFNNEDGTEQEFAGMTVHNSYEIANVIRFMDNDNLYLPTHLLIMLVSISISHTRALFAKSLDGTAFNGIILPVIDPAGFSRHVFKEMFEHEDLKKIDNTKGS